MDLAEQQCFKYIVLLEHKLVVDHSQKCYYSIESKNDIKINIKSRLPTTFQYI